MDDAHNGSILSLFTARRITWIAWVTLTSIVFLNVFIKFINRNYLNGTVKIPKYWPISRVFFQLPRLDVGWAIVLVVGSLLGFAIATKYVVDAPSTSILPVICASSILVVLTNLAQDFATPGPIIPVSTIARPVTSGDLPKFAYYTEAVAITDPVIFVRTFEQQQLDLALHAQTHPPGAVLTFYVYDVLFGEPEYVSLAIAVSALGLSSVFLYRYLLTSYDRQLAQYVTFLFTLVPAIQIYTLTTLDALIAAFLFGSVYFFTRTDAAVSIVGTFVCLFIASFQTFMAIFAVPVLAGVTLVRRKKILPLVVVLGAVALSYGLLYLFVDFNYVHSFALASSQQHRATEGFLLLVSPYTYLITRIENVLEIALFFTPFLCLLTIRGIPALRVKREELVLTSAAVISLLGLFLASVYHTGETARAAMYSYPFLMLPVAAALESVETSRGDRWRLAVAVFGQSLLMQLVGFYFW